MEGPGVSAGNFLGVGGLNFVFFGGRIPTKSSYTVKRQNRWRVGARALKKS